MSSNSVKKFYREVVDQLFDQSLKSVWEEEGLDETTLTDLKELWEAKLSKAGVDYQKDAGTLDNDAAPHAPKTGRGSGRTKNAQQAATTSKSASPTPSQAVKASTSQQPQIQSVQSQQDVHPSSAHGVPHQPFRTSQSSQAQPITLSSQQSSGLPTDQMFHLKSSTTGTSSQQPSGQMSNITMQQSANNHMYALPGPDNAARYMQANQISTPIQSRPSTIVNPQNQPQHHLQMSLPNPSPSPMSGQIRYPQGVIRQLPIDPQVMEELFRLNKQQHAAQLGMRGNAQNNPINVRQLATNMQGSLRPTSVVTLNNGQQYASIPAANLAGLYQLGNQPLVRFPTNASSGGQSSVIHIADGSGNHAPALLLPGNSSVQLGSVSVASVANSANVAARKNPQTFVSQLDGRDDDDDDDEFEDLSDADLDSPPSSFGKPPPKKQKVSRSPMSETERLEKEEISSGDDDDDSSGNEFDDTIEDVVVCQYEKVNRVRNKWKFHLKSGMCNLNGKSYVFHKATGDAEF